MTLSIKNKIRFGTLFLFVLLVLTGGLSMFYLTRLKNETANIVKDNYETLDYGHAMQRYLDSMRSETESPTLLSRFELELRKQEQNVTEPGEQEATRKLRQDFDSLRGSRYREVVLSNMAHDIQDVLSLNMKAIERKNNAARESAESMSSFLMMIVAVTIIVGLTFSYNFPGILTTPIMKLREGMREITARNYKFRIHLDNKDEFGELAETFNGMNERLEEFESSNLNKIIFEKRRAEAVINSLKDASIGIDQSGTILFANQQALQLLGIPAEEAVGKITDELAARNDLFKFLLNEEGNSPFKIVVDGKENYYVREIINVAQGQANNKVILLKNITSFKELDVAKTNFIATVSHELKTPLASSDFSLKLLADHRVGPLSSDQQELIEQLKKDNQRMLRILSELLNMAQVEAGKIILNIQQLEPARAVEDSIMAIRNMALEKQIQIVNESEPGLPTIPADADKINWVLNNFLTNAIRYSPAQSKIIIKATRNPGAISFSVADAGSGIEEAYQQRIFERYFQVPGRSDKKGSGIGLAICKEFIEAMDGKIWIHSRPSEGSIFGFDLPFSEGK